MREPHKTIREMWDADADEYNMFCSLDSEEIEQFADEQIDRLRARIAELESAEISVTVVDDPKNERRLFGNIIEKEPNDGCAHGFILLCEAKWNVDSPFERIAELEELVAHWSSQSDHASRLAVDRYRCIAELEAESKRWHNIADERAAEIVELDGRVAELEAELFDA